MERFGKDLNMTEDEKSGKAGPICQEDFYYKDVITCNIRPYPDGYWDGTYDGKKRKHRYSEHQPFYEMRNDGSGEPYDNVLQMRAAKIYNFLDTVKFPWVEARAEMIVHPGRAGIALAEDGDGFDGTLLHSTAPAVGGMLNILVDATLTTILIVAYPTLLVLQSGHFNDALTGVVVHVQVKSSHKNERKRAEAKISSRIGLAPVLGGRWTHRCVPALHVSIPIPIGSVPMAIVRLGTPHWVHHCSGKQVSKQINDEQARPMPEELSVSNKRHGGANLNQRGPKCTPRMSLYW